MADRQLSWGATSYGSHAETAIEASATTWYLAEGSAAGDFTLFYLLQNPQNVEVAVTIRNLRSLGLPPVERRHALPPNSRTTIGVASEGLEVASADVSAVIVATAPIIVERAMYRNTPDQLLAAGHASAGITAPSTRWFLAEGATGPFFDLFILLANPTDEAAHVRIDYLLESGAKCRKTTRRARRTPGSSSQRSSALVFPVTARRQTQKAGAQ